MGQRSSIDQLPEAVRTEVDAAIGRGATIDEIVWTLKGLGAAVSRSAVGRYSKQYRDLAARQRDIASVAKGFAADFGQGDDMQGRLMVQLVTSLITRVAMPAVAGEEDDLPDFKELHYLARAVKDAASAAKTDQEREAKVRQQERQRAAKDAEDAGRAAGASAETIDLIKKRILGVSQ
jgi:hypothetical protein